jgi:two-component system response regulator NreC
MTSPIRVLLADDHTIVRSGVKMLLRSEPDIEVIGEAEDGREAVQMAINLQPDIVVMDIAMPEIDGLEATRQIKASCPNTNVLVLTMHRTDEYFFEMLRAGASGYVLKAAGTNELIHAMRVIAMGDVYLYPTMAKKLLSDYLEKVKHQAPIETGLSRRESEILALIAEGYTNNEIAEKLVISASTVHTHRSKLLQKLNLSSRHELIQYARQAGIIKES